MNEQYIYEWLLNRLNNEIGVCALMGNLYVESGLQPIKLENKYAKKFNMTSQEYTDAWDLAEDANSFIHDQAGYGLAQWTFWSRKQGLHNWAKENGRSVGNLDIQLGYLWKEIQGYKTVIKALIGATNLRAASDEVCLKYEKPEHTEEKYLVNRADYGQKYYDRFANQNGSKKERKSMSVKVSDWWPYIQGPYDEKWGYIYGTSGQMWTQAKQTDLEKKYASDPERYSDLEKGAKYGSRWIGKYVIDCSGMPYRAFNKLGVKIAHGSNSIWNSYLSQKGKLTDKSAAFLATLPKGAAILTGNDSSKPHIGTYDGNGYVIEARGTTSGVVKTSINDSKWKYWGLYKDLDYDVSPVPVPEPGDTKPTLRKGDKGEFVTLLQTLLIGRNYSLPKYGADGSFGKETEDAVKQFQRDHGLTADGIVGKMTWAALDADPTPQKLYTVTIPDRTKDEAEALLRQYPGVMIIQE